MMAALFASGTVIDLILAGVAAEALLLTLLCRRAPGRVPDLRGLLLNLASGAGLMLALRAALTGAGWPPVAGWMLVGLACHVLDLALRFREASIRAASGGGMPQEPRRARRVHANNLEQL